MDYQVRQFTSDSIHEVMSRLRDEQPQTYRNVYGQEVRWIFDDTVAIEFDLVFRDGAEVIGFITGKPAEITEDAAPNSRPPSQLPSSPEVQKPDSLRTTSSGGCG